MDNFLPSDILHWRKKAGGDITLQKNQIEDLLSSKFLSNLNIILAGQMVEFSSLFDVLYEVSNLDHFKTVAHPALIDRISNGEAKHRVDVLIATEKALLFTEGEQLPNERRGKAWLKQFFNANNNENGTMVIFYDSAQAPALYHDMNPLRLKHLRPAHIHPLEQAAKIVELLIEARLVTPENQEAAYNFISKSRELVAQVNEAAAGATR